MKETSVKRKPVADPDYFIKGINVKIMLVRRVIVQVLGKRVIDPDYLRAHLRKRKFVVKLTAVIRTGLDANFAGHGRFKAVVPSGPADFSISAYILINLDHVLKPIVSLFTIKTT